MPPAQDVNETFSLLNSEGRIVDVNRRLHSRPQEEAAAGAPKGKTIVHRVSDVLLAAEVTFCRLHRGVTEQELNLLKLTPAGVTQLRARPSQVVRSDVVQPRSLAASPDHVPHDILRDPPAPDPANFADGSEYPASCDTGR